MPLSAVEALQLTLVVVSLVFAGACYLGWRLFDHPRHALIWSLAFVLAALQYTFNLLREFSPSYEWWWVSVNTLSCLLVLTAAVVNLLFALAQGLAALIALQFGTEATQEQRDLYNLVNFALMPTFFVAMGVTVIFLLATDLATRLRQQAVTDSLTGMSNRRGFMQLAGRLFGLARRQDQPLTLVLADLDFFKRINDRYGHSVGDRTLVHFARTLARCLRSEEVSARIGGEEFAVLLAGEEADACTLIDRLREAMRAHPLEEGGSRILLTASFGVAQRSGEESVETLLMRADEALYRAKGAGRDTLVIAPGPAPPRMVSRA